MSGVGLQTFSNWSLIEIQWTVCKFLYHSVLSRCMLCVRTSIKLQVLVWLHLNCIRLLSLTSRSPNTRSNAKRKRQTMLIYNHGALLSYRTKYNPNLYFHDKMARQCLIYRNYNATNNAYSFFIISKVCCIGCHTSQIRIISFFNEKQTCICVRMLLHI